MSTLDELVGAAGRPQATPYRAFLPRAAMERFRGVADTLRGMGDERLSVRGAYSIKTNPSGPCLSLARSTALLAEAISPEEVSAAVACGFALEDVVYNGPFALDAGTPRVGIAFADSPQAFAAYLQDDRATIPGIRLRPSRVPSRFGATLEELPSILDLLKSHAGRDLGVSFQVRAEDLKAESWRDVLTEALELAEAIEANTRHRVSVLDVGGGRDPAAFDRWLEHDFGPSISSLRSRLPNVRTVVVELGQEIATPSACLVTTVLEDRRGRGAGECVVDASIALLSHAHAYPHPALLRSGGSLSALPAGHGRILGCACLEDDILAVDLDLSQVAAGDRLVFASCGSYDASMAYDFARGTFLEVKPRKLFTEAAEQFPTTTSLSTLV